MLLLVFTRQKTTQSECTTYFSFLLHLKYTNIECIDNTEETEHSLFYAVNDSVLIYSNVLNYIR